MARVTLRNHPKFRLLVHLLRMHEPHVLGHLEFLWSVAYESGEDIIGDAIQVELSAGWIGEPGALCAALLAAGGKGSPGFIEQLDDGRFKIHNLYIHAPEYVKKRMDREAARRAVGKTIQQSRAEAARKRWDDDENQPPRLGVQQTSDRANGNHLHANGSQCHANGSQCHANGTPPAPAPAPAPALKKECSEPASAAASPPPSLASPGEMTTYPDFPVVGNGHVAWRLEEEKIREWKTAFPGVDIAGECRKAHAWLKANPTKRKTARGMDAFLFRWLEKAQNQGRRTAPTFQPPAESRTKPQQFGKV